MKKGVTFLTPATLRVGLGSDGQMNCAHNQKLVEALRANTSIAYIRLHGNFLGCLRITDRRKLIKSIGFVKSIQEVHLDDTLWMVSDIMDMLVEAKGLRVLKLNKLILQGVLEDFQAAEMALYQHICLKEKQIKVSMLFNNDRETFAAHTPEQS